MLPARRLGSRTSDISSNASTVSRQFNTTISASVLEA